MHQKFAAVSVEGFLFNVNIHSLCKCTHYFPLELALKYTEKNHFTKCEV